MIMMMIIISIIMIIVLLVENVAIANALKLEAARHQARPSPL